MIRIYADDLVELVDQLCEWPLEYEQTIAHLDGMLDSYAFISLETSDPTLINLVRQFNIKHKELA